MSEEKNTDTDQKHLAPARGSISYKAQYFTNDKISAREYFGEPSAEREAAWEELLGRKLSRLSTQRSIESKDV
jgi:hypothetical protein